MIKVSLLLYSSSVRSGWNSFGHWTWFLHYYFPKWYCLFSLHNNVWVGNCILTSGITINNSRYLTTCEVLLQWACLHCKWYYLPLRYHLEFRGVISITLEHNNVIKHRVTWQWCFRSCKHIHSWDYIHLVTASFIKVFNFLFNSNCPV